MPTFGNPSPSKIVQTAAAAALTYGNKVAIDTKQTHKKLAVQTETPKFEIL